MRLLVDTNILTRASQPNHPQHQDATAVVTALANRGHNLSPLSYAQCPSGCFLHQPSANRLPSRHARRA